MTHNPWNNSDFTPPPKTRWWSSRVMLIIVLAIAVFVGLIIFWNLIISHTDDVDESNIPVIAAETLTIKERPQETVVEEGDSVYGLISKEKSKAASLKTDVEEPVYETSFQPSTENDGPKVEVAENQTEVIEMKKTTMAPVRKRVSKSEKKGEFFLQIGSLPSEGEAKNESQRLKKKHEMLQQVQLKIVPKNISGKGTYYRIHAGPFADKEKAISFCQELTQAGHSCLLVG